MKAVVEIKHTVLNGESIRWNKISAILSGKSISWNKAPCSVVKALSKIN